MFNGAYLSAQSRWKFEACKAYSSLQELTPEADATTLTPLLQTVDTSKLLQRYAKQWLLREETNHSPARLARCSRQGMKATFEEEATQDCKQQGLGLSRGEILHECTTRRL